MKKGTKFLGIVTSVILALMFFPQAVFAWSGPVVTALCAPDGTHFSFNVNLASESNYNMQWSWSANFSDPTPNIKLLHSGDNTVTVPSGSHNSGDTWYIRFVSDTGAVGSAKANGTLCHKSHTVTWSQSSNCTGWSATYSIDGGTPVVYDSGVWSKPFVLETATPKAFTVPEIQGDTYDYPNSPSVTIYEDKSCQVTHQVTWGNDNTCGTWDVWYAIDGGSHVVYGAGSWSKPFDLESANVNAFNIPTNSGELYNVTQIPPVTINEAGKCQITHQVTYNVDNNCQGWSAWYNIDGGSKVVYASGTWTEPFDLESANVAVFSIPTNSGELYNITQIPAVTVNEAGSCQVTHKVTYDITNDCTGWTAWYAIDGGAHQTYAGGTWSEPFVLENVDVPAYNVPTNPGELYDNTVIPEVKINEGTSCQVSHKVTWNSGANCDEWWATYSIDGGTPVIYDQGSWSQPFVLETATPKAFTVPEVSGEVYDYPNAPSGAVIKEPSSCQVTHKVTNGVDNNCVGWNAWYTIDGGDKQIYASGIWAQPFDSTPVNVPVYNLQETKGQIYDHDQIPAQVISDSESCQPTASFNIGAACSTSGGTGSFIDLTAKGVGYTFSVEGVPGFPVNGGTMPALKNQNYVVTYTLIPGYKGESGSETVNKVASCWKNPPIPVCATCGPHQDETLKEPNDLLVDNYAVGECHVCLTSYWGTTLDETWRVVQSKYSFYIQVSASPQILDAHKIKYRTQVVDGVTEVFIDSVQITSSLDGQTYWVLDLPKSISDTVITGSTWQYFDTATNKPYEDVYGAGTTTRSDYTSCSRSVWPIDVVGGNGSTQFGGMTSSEWVTFLIGHGIGGDKAITWSQDLWKSKNGTLALPGGFK
jgi:hypothetical protein